MCFCISVLLSLHETEIDEFCSEDRSAIGNKPRKRKCRPPPRPGVTFFEMVLEVIVALTNRALKKRPLRTLDQHKQLKRTWDKKDQQRRERKKQRKEAAANMLVKVLVGTYGGVNYHASQPCGHECQNKALCGHLCCRKSVPNWQPLFRQGIVGGVHINCCNFD